MAEEDILPSHRCLRLCVLQWPPFISSITGQPPNYKVTGILAGLVEILARELNVCVEYVVARDRTFGYRFPNGTWTGIMGLLTRQEADMSAIVLSLDVERAAAVSLSEPLYMDAQAVGYKTPVLEPDVLGFVKPYTYMVWVLLGLALLGVMAITFFIHYTYVRVSRTQGTDAGKREKSDQDDDDVLTSVWIAYLWTITAPLAQASSWWPKGDSVRVITGLWLLMAFILGSVYRSNLKAMMIMPILRLPFNNIEELIESRITTFVVKGSILDQAIMDAPEGSSLNRLKEQAIVHYDLRKVSIDLAQGKMAAFLSKRAFTYLLHSKFSKYGRCILYMADETAFGGTALSLAFPKGSPLKAKVDPIIQSLKESGILEQLFLQGTKNASHCFSSSLKNKLDPQLRPLDLVDFYGIFLVYTVGILISLLIFTVELISGLLDQRQQLRQQSSSSSP